MHIVSLNNITYYITHVTKSTFKGMVHLKFVSELNLIFDSPHKKTLS